MRPFFATFLLRSRCRESGVALILVMFVVALASILVINTVYSVHLSARMNSAVERGLQAEYVLKSAVNFARVLIKEDTSPEDARKDPWGQFVDGVMIPPGLLPLGDPNMRVWLEIRPEESKFPLRAVVVSTQGRPEVQWRDALVRLFQSLGFDDDSETDQSGYYPDRHFNSQELVANLIDYMDPDNEDYTAENFASGIEGDGVIPKDLFANERIERVGELSAIPGFTPGRIRKMSPFITTYGSNRVNLNVAPAMVIRSLSDQLGDAEVSEILKFRDGDEGPFDTVNLGTQLTKIIGEDSYNEVRTMVSAQSRWFQVLAKVDNGTTIYFLRSFLSKGTTGELPRVRSVELF